ncbi:unnamed protein product [Amoebophrya sp. A25]|nr:unnamed protein product [Amoebophrya sp. A25]|eukprot:GSA25T00015698001.1
MPPKAKAKTKAVQEAAAAPGLPLSGKTFVFTGEMEGMDRDTATEKVKCFGGKVTGSVSGRTTYLVAGSRLEHAGGPANVEDTSKYKAAQKLIDDGKPNPIKILREDDFLELLNSAGGSAGQQVAPRTSTPGAPAPSSYTAGNMPPAARGSVSASSSAGQPMQAMSAPAGPAPKQGGHIPWVVKYAPKSVDELQGHQTQVRKLSEWLRDWDEVVLNGNKKPVSNFRGQPENLNARGALITGPPGIGKTTAVRLICEQFKGTHIAQWYNASDSRSKKVIDQLSMGIAQVASVDWANGGKLVAGTGSASGSSGRTSGGVVTKRTIIVMDEADGMGAGDRMGTSALAKLIKTSSNPVICIANDSGREQKMRTLAGQCYDVKFSRPVKTQIAKRLAFICAKEGVHSEPNALESLAEACGNDLRQAITQCQSLASRGTGRIVASGIPGGLGTATPGGAGAAPSLTFANTKDKIKEIEKDMTVDGFAAAKKLLTASENRKMSFYDKTECFFKDYDMVPLLIQENYLKYYESSQAKNMMDVAFAADLIATGDIYNKVMRKENQWSLLPDIGVVSSIYPTQRVNGFRNFPDFPQWLGKNSSANKSKRLVKELHEALWSKTSLTPDQMICSGFTELLYIKVMKLLKAGDITAAAQQLDKLGLSKDHLMTQLSECRTPFELRDDYKLLDSDVKKKLTNELKKPEYTNQGGKGLGLKRSKKEKGEKQQRADVDGQEHDQESDSEESEEPDEAEQIDEAVKALAKSRAKAKAKGKANAKKKQKVG